MQFLDELETETILAADVIATGGKEGRTEYVAQQATTNARRDAFLAAEAKAPNAQRSSIAVRNALAAADGLDELRTFKVGGLDLNRDGLLSNYVQRMNNLLTLDNSLASATSEPELVRVGIGVTTNALTRSLRAHLAGYVLTRLNDNIFDRIDQSVIAGLDESATRASAFTREILGDLLVRLEAGPDVAIAEAARAQATSAVIAALEAGAPVRLTTAQWRDINLKALDVTDVTDDRVFAEYTATAASIASNARNEAILYGLLALIGFATAAISAYAIGNSLTRRLARVTGRARAVATDELPKVLETLRNPTPEALAGAIPEVKAEGSDEIGILADSFNSVLRTSVETSIEHSARRAQTLTNLLVNLGRRNQTLIDRQLDLIDRLEADVDDPRVLEGLFTLDHTVTRMRRNAESLLVLAGSRRSRAWSEPVHMSDVIRGAISEVADMNRVNLDLAPGNDMMLAGQYAVDLSHLLAEIIENATLYSSPTTPVSVRVQRTALHFRVWIIDLGVGMTDDELELSNHRVSDPPDIDELTTDQVGFQVVGRLARRLDAAVRLQNNPAGGVAVSIDLPPQLFESLFPERHDDAESVATHVIDLTDAAIDALTSDGRANPVVPDLPSAFAGRAEQRPPARPDDDVVAPPAVVADERIEVPVIANDDRSLARYQSATTPAKPEPATVGALPARNRGEAATARRTAEVTPVMEAEAAAIDLTETTTANGLAKRQPGRNRTQTPDPTSVNLFDNRDQRPRTDKRRTDAASDNPDIAAKRRAEMLARYTQGVVNGRSTGPEAQGAKGSAKNAPANGNERRDDKNGNGKRGEGR